MKFIPLVWAALWRNRAESALRLLALSVRNGHIATLMILEAVIPTLLAALIGSVLAMGVDTLLQAKEQYRSAVLAAFQNVADVLAALEHDAEALRASAASTEAAKVTLAVVRAQRNAGYANYLQLLSAEETYQTAVISQLQAQTHRFADTAALFQALGGGWWNRSDARRGGLAADHSRKSNTD